MRAKPVRALCLGWLALAAAPLIAADPDSDAATVSKAKRYFGITSAALDCPTAPDGTIVVCARRRPPPRVDPPERSTTTRPDPKATAYGRSPVPHLGGGVTTRACILQKCPKKLYFFDIKALPEAPPDSDADKIARGEMRAR